MKRTLARLVATAALAAAGQAHAMSAVLLDCSLGQSAMGAPIWVGTYIAPSGQTFARGFPISSGTCPASVAVY